MRHAVPATIRRSRALPVLCPKIRRNSKPEERLCSADKICPPPLIRLVDARAKLGYIVSNFASQSVSRKFGARSLSPLAVIGSSAGLEQRR